MKKPYAIAAGATLVAVVLALGLTGSSPKKAEAVGTCTSDLNCSITLDWSGWNKASDAYMWLNRCVSFLKLTTVSGTAYFTNPAKYGKGNWYKARSDCDLAARMDRVPKRIDSATNLLANTTISGVTYFKNPGNPGKWKTAMGYINAEKTYLAGQNYLDPPVAR